MKRSCPGFTLVELLVVASIMIILFVVGVASYTQFNRGQILDQAGLELKNNLRLAQSRASSGEKPPLVPPTPCNFLEGYRVTFISGVDNDSYQVQAQCSNGLKGDIRTFSFPAVVRFGTVPSPILFKVLAQGTNLPTNLTISLTGFGQSKLITVTKEGKIE